MRTSTVKLTDITNNCRLDSPYYLSEGATANRIITNWAKEHPYIILSDENVATVWQPGRSTIVLAGENEEYIPYIQPYDILEYLPSERSRVSSHQSDIEALRINAGTILMTCSGRNLGPLVIADKFLEKYILGSDMIRVDIFDKKIRNYVYAFFSTWIGQALLHSSKTGSVIDHLSTKDVGEIRIPLADTQLLSEIDILIDKAQTAFSAARMTLSKLMEEFNNQIGINREEKKLSSGWSVSYRDIMDNMRIDAAFYDPFTKDARERLRQAGGVFLEEVADVVKPSGRYKTNYVESDYGTPLISGRQLLQNQVVGMKYLPYSYDTSFSKFKLCSDYIAYPADGRVEGRLGDPVLIPPSRNGWYASGHVGRVVAKEGIHAGYIFLAMAHPAVQAQMHATACGSVVDAVYPEYVEKIIVPPLVDFPYDEVVKAWYLFDDAEENKNKACAIITEFLDDGISRCH